VYTFYDSKVDSSYPGITAICRIYGVATKISNFRWVLQKSV